MNTAKKYAYLAERIQRDISALNGGHICISVRDLCTYRERREFPDISGPICEVHSVHHSVPEYLTRLGDGCYSTLYAIAEDLSIDSLTLDPKRI